MKTNLKKKTMLLLLSATFATMSLTLFAGPTAKTNIFINSELRATGFVEDDRSFIPLRDVSEALGAVVDWEGKTKTVTISKDGTTIIQKIGETTATVNGKKIDAGAPAQIKNSKTYVPLRFVSETLGTAVNWDANTRSVQIVAHGIPSKSEADQAKWEALVKNATPTRSFPLQPVSSYTTMDKVPIGNHMGQMKPLFDKFSTIEKNQLPIKLYESNTVLAIDTTTHNGQKVLIMTLEVGNRVKSNSFIYASKKEGFLTERVDAIPNTTETLAELNIDGEKTFIITQKFRLSDSGYKGVDPSLVDGVVFVDFVNRTATMVKMKL